jgi:hypothetical protein
MRQLRSKLARAGAIVALFSVSACPTRPADRPMPIEKPDDCVAGCARLEELKCADILGELQNQEDKNLDTCEKACRHLINSGTVLNVSCWKDAKTCAEFDTTCS